MYVGGCLYNQQFIESMQLKSYKYTFFTIVQTVRQWENSFVIGKKLQWPIKSGPQSLSESEQAY